MDIEDFADWIGVNVEDITKCMVTYDQTLAKLEEIEAKLAKRWNLTGYIEDLDYHGTIRENLIYILDDKEEDELVQDWNQQFSSYYHWLKDDYQDKYIELFIFMELCHYKIETFGLSFIKRANSHYQNILHCGKFNPIIPLIKYLNFGWVVFSLLSDIVNNDWLDFPREHAGKFDKVKEYWLNWYNCIF